MKKIICLYGGPGSGKSTTAAGLFYEAKRSGLNCELNREYVKDWVWEDRKIQPGDQTYYFAKQARKERIYMQKGLDLIITDSPLILTHYYGMLFDPFEQTSNTSLVMLKHHHEICKYYGYKVEHFVINRTKEYNSAGRLQTKEEAIEIDKGILNLLNVMDIKYDVVDYEDAPKTILEQLT